VIDIDVSVIDVDLSVINIDVLVIDANDSVDVLKLCWVKDK